MQNFRKLVVWQKAHILAVRTKEATEKCRSDSSGTVRQARRAALSIPTNIAEGCNRATNRDFANFLQIAIASAGELEYQLLYATDTKLIKRSEANRLLYQVVEVRRMLYGLLKAVRERRKPPDAPAPDETAPQ